MNKKLKSILIGGVVLVALIAVLLVLVLTEKEPVQEESSSASSSVVVLWKANREDVQKVVVQNEKGGYEATVGADQKLTIPAIAEGYNLKSNDLVTLQNCMATLTATRLVEKSPEDLEKYGLNQPVATAEATLADGTKNVIFIGGDLPTSGGYYVQVNEDPNVYAVASVDVAKLFYSTADFLDLTIIAGSEEEEADISRIQVDGGNFTDAPLVLEKVENSSGYGSGYNITSPITAGLNSTTGESLVKKLQSMTASEAAAIANTDSDKAAFGLDKPTATVTYVRNGEEGTLFIGAETTIKDGTAARYLMKQGSNVVYKVTEINLPWLTAKIDHLFSSLLLLPAIDTVDTLTIEANGESYAFTSSGDTQNLEAELNGNAVDTTNYRYLYEFVISASAQEINRGSEKGDSLAKVTFHYRDSAKSDDVIEYFAVSDRKCIISLNGSDSFLAETRYVDKLIANCQKVADGEAPSLDY